MTAVRNTYEIRGIVQGVGFRPYVANLCDSLELRGWIRNTSFGVLLEVEGDNATIRELLRHIHERPPSLARVESTRMVATQTGVSPAYSGFDILESDADGRKDVSVSADACVCDECLSELFDQGNRRYRYPFINCTNCGPRYSIVSDLPYDRKNTTMSPFGMCNACRREYEDRRNRRFHAEPIACPACGPRYALLDATGSPVVAHDPVKAIGDCLKSGEVVAVKGIGGFHLMVDATNETAVRLLRERKERPYKPFGLISDNLEKVSAFARLDDDARGLLREPARPIVLLEKTCPSPVAEAVAPNCASYGVMLAYAPVHHMLLRDQFLALVATSANRSGSPIIYDDEEAVSQLKGIADHFLVNDRKIINRQDDSVVQLPPGGKGRRPVVSRRARGYAPLPFITERPLPPMLAVGAELKNSVAISTGVKIIQSQYLGDLKNIQTHEFFTETIASMMRLHGVHPEAVACDMHPDMHSTRYARSGAFERVIAVQHHHAHMASCMFEHGITDPTIGVIFDGIGYGLDGTLWGGEFFYGDCAHVERFAHFRQFPLLGGNLAMKEPYRVTVAMLEVASGQVDAHKCDALYAGMDEEKLATLRKMYQHSINAPLTSSVGRVFDAVAAILVGRHYNTYEAQAAMELEALASACLEKITTGYPFDFVPSGSVVIVDWAPMLRKIVDDIAENVDRSRIARKFHKTLARIITETCGLIKSKTSISTVVLSGGVFQNQILLRETCDLLQESAFKVFHNEKVPTNDSGISFGQIAVAASIISG